VWVYEVGYGAPIRLGREDLTSGKPIGGNDKLRSGGVAGHARRTVVFRVLTSHARDGKFDSSVPYHNERWAVAACGSGKYPLDIELSAVIDRL